MTASTLKGIRFFLSFFGASAISLSLTACQPQNTIFGKSPPARSDVVSSDFTLTVLGSGTPLPSRTQVGTALLVEAGETLLLFDCGRACTKRIEQYNPALISKIDKLFLTHLHSDHTVGIPDLWLNGWTQGRQLPLQIWGPDGVKGMMRGLRNAYAADIGYRSKPSQPEAPGLKVRFNVLGESGDIVFEFGDLTVMAFTVKHANIPAYGYRVDYAGRSILISGDTTATPNLGAFGANADVVLLEVLSPAMVDTINTNFKPTMVEYILSLHLTTAQASDVFKQINPQLGVYYHTVAGCETDKRLLAETSKTYSGPVVVAHDLMKIHLYRDRVETRYLSMGETICQ